MSITIKKLLIANRGEIAIRIARTCRRMGIKTIGIYSEQDSKSLHLNFCDEVYTLGDGTITETYLNIPKITDIIRKSKADAVHPGYGFLSERSLFAKAVKEVGAVFVGPKPESMDAMGDKIEAKKQIAAMGVPLLPGTPGGVSDISIAKKEASRIGYPILLKAASGGGGKGMRIIRSEKDLASGLESAAREAKSYFGDETVYIEKYLENPHHVEVQVMGDGLGGGGHVFDRECSIQRRHQKLVEESPAPLLERHPNSKQKILSVASSVVEQMKYANAGTLEFLADDEGEFYFLEMNTRLQVEHPVTEWVTGLDLVEYQIRIACGEKLIKGPLVPRQNGHAIEVRIYAEDGFSYLPSAGKVIDLQLPSGPFVRVDSAIYNGYDVLTDYDPTLMKLSVWGSNRNESVDRLRGAIDELRILGVGSNQALFWAITREGDFKNGMYGTPYLEKRKAELKNLYDNEFKILIEKLLRGAVEVSHKISTGSDSSSAKFSIANSIWESESIQQGIRGKF